jgi:hypothetical protein
MQNFIQEDDTGFFEMIYEVVETHEYSSDVTIFRTGFRSIAEKFIQEKTVHVLKNLKYREEDEEIRNYIHRKVKEIIGDDYYAFPNYDYVNESEEDANRRIEYQEKYNDEFDKQQDNLPIEVRAKLFAEYYQEDYLEHLEIKEVKLYLDFKKNCLLDPCTKELLRDDPDAEKILELLA